MMLPFLTGRCSVGWQALIVCTMQPVIITYLWPFSLFDIAAFFARQCATPICVCGLHIHGFNCHFALCKAVVRNQVHQNERLKSENEMAAHTLELAE